MFILIKYTDLWNLIPCKLNFLKIFKQFLMMNKKISSLFYFDAKQIKKNKPRNSSSNCRISLFPIISLNLMFIIVKISKDSLAEESRTETNAVGETSCSIKFNLYFHVFLCNFICIFVLATSNLNGMKISFYSRKIKKKEFLR